MSDKTSLAESTLSKIKTLKSESKNINEFSAEQEYVMDDINVCIRDLETIAKKMDSKSYTVDKNLVSSVRTLKSDISALGYKFDKLK